MGSGNRKRPLASAVGGKQKGREGQQQQQQQLEKKQARPCEDDKQQRAQHQIFLHTVILETFSVRNMDAVASYAIREFFATPQPIETPVCDVPWESTMFGYKTNQTLFSGDHDENYLRFIVIGNEVPVYSQIRPTRYLGNS